MRLRVDKNLVGTEETVVIAFGMWVGKILGDCMVRELEIFNLLAKAKADSLFTKQ